MTFPAPSRCPRVRRRTRTSSAYPSSSPRPFSSSPTVSLPRDRPTVSAPPSFPPSFLSPSSSIPAPSRRPKSPITQEDSSHLGRKLISSINSRDHHHRHRVVLRDGRGWSLPPSSLLPLTRSTFVNVIRGDLCKPKTNPRSVLPSLPPSPLPPMPEKKNADATAASGRVELFIISA